MRKISLADLKNKHILALIGNGVISVFAVLTMALLTRSLTKADVGMWFYFLGIYSLGEAIRSGFLGTATMKFYAGTEKARADNVLGSVWFWAAGITAALLLINVAAIPFLPYIHDAALAVSIRWFGITLLSSLPFNLIFWILVADERYDKILQLRMLNSGSMIAVIAVLMLTHHMTLSALLWCNLLTNLLTSIAGMLMGLARLDTVFKRTKSTALELFHFGKFNLATTFTSKLFCNIDAFVITAMLGPAAFAVFNIPMKLMEIVEVPLRSFVGTGMSAMAIAYNQKNVRQATYIFTKYSGMLTIAFIPLSIGTFLLADVAIYLLGGKQYMGTEAANLFRILMFIAILYPVDRFIGVTLDIIHRPKINFYKVLVMLVFAAGGDLIGVWAFKSLYAVMGSALLTVLSGLLFGYYQLRKDLDFSFRTIISSGIYEMKEFLSKMLAGKRQ